MPVIPPTPLVVTALPTTITITAAQFNAGIYGNGANEAYVRLDAPLSGYVGWEPNYNGTTITTTIYHGVGLVTLQGAGAPPVGWFAPILLGDIYYVWLRKGSAIGVDLTITLSSRLGMPPLTVGATLIVNDDGATFDDAVSYLPATVMNLAGTVLGFIDGPPAGELMAALGDGTTIWHDRFLRYGVPLSIFDTAYALVTSVDTVPGLGAGFPRLAEDGTTFWVFNTVNKGLYSISSAGVVSGVRATITRVPAAMNVLNGVLYYVENGTEFVFKHDLITDTPLPNLGPFPDPAGDISRVALTPNGHPGDLLTLPDGSIVTWYSLFGTGIDVLIHLSAAGVVLHRHVYDRTLRQIDHLDYAESGSASVAVWWLDNTTSFSTGRFAAVRLADATELWGFDIPLFSAGVNEFDETPFGPSGSCDFVLFGFGTPLTPLTPGVGCPTDLAPSPPGTDPGCPAPFFP